MRIEFFGVRGTVPSTAAAGTDFGRNTACVAVTSPSGDLLVLDAGTGLKALGDRLAGPGEKTRRRIHLLLTHFHFDHIQGLPFFAPLDSAGTETFIYSGIAPRALRRTLVRFLAPPFFPAAFADTASPKRFFRIGAEPVEVGGLAVTSCPLRHPQACVSYRLQENGEALVFATDTEHPPSGFDERLAAFARGARWLVYDAMYTPEEYEAGRRGWGHSTWAAGVALARAAEVGRLLLFHLNPDYSDADLRRLEALAQKEFPRTVCAREGLLDPENLQP
jgi:phosphoribosyl 1,2-cyclic phosphodiesterase